MEKTILYYKFVNVKDPDMAVRWQKELCARLGLKGRIIISPHGINGTLGGSLIALRRYKSHMNASGIFRGIHYKWSEVDGDVFPKLSVKVRPELVAFDAPDEVKVDDETGVIGGGERIRPNELHTFLENNPDAIFFDGRNLYESTVGRFQNAVIPEVRTSRDFLNEISDDKYDSIKDKPIISYCTGGIRCEILTVLMKNRGFSNIYQLDGGIVSFGKAYPHDPLWEGSCYVFDGRLLERFSDDAPVIGSCCSCGKSTENYSHCADNTCSSQMLLCDNCDSGERIHLCSACAVHA